ALARGQRLDPDAVTTSSVIDESQEGEAEIIARERAVVCGLGVVEAVFTRFDWRTRVRTKVSDGDAIAAHGVEHEGVRRGSDRGGRRGGDRARSGGGAAGGRAHGAELPVAPVRDRDA